MRITFVGNFGLYWSSETYHCRTLEAMGHEVFRFQDHGYQVDKLMDAARSSDLVVWIHWPMTGPGAMPEVLREARAAGAVSLAYHADLFFGIGREADLKGDPAYLELDHFFSGDPKTAAWFSSETPVRGHWLPPAVFAGDCEMAPPRKEGFKHEVVFVGSRSYHEEWTYRPLLVDWLATTYGERFVHIGHDGEGSRYGADLNRLYADTKVVVGDSLCLDYTYEGYWSDRVYETLGRGGFLIHPHVPGMEKQFTDGEHLKFYRYGDFADLKDQIDRYLKEDQEREEIRRRGFEHVKAHHTYAQRWQRILETVQAGREPSSVLGDSGGSRLAGAGVLEVPEESADVQEPGR